MIKIIIIDDQSLMRDGLEIILSSSPDISVLACGRNGYDAVSLTEKLAPSLVLMDIRMPVMDGVEATKIIKSLYPKIVILILTTFNDDDYIIDALSFGASGYILKDIEGDDLIKSINDAYKGSFMLPSDVAIKIAKRLTKTSIVTLEQKKSLSDFSATRSSRI